MMPCEELKSADIRNYFDEFTEAGEECNVLWALAQMSVDEWVENIKKDRHTIYAAFIVKGKVAGIGRITPHPNHIANGMIGYAIRPSEREKGLAVEMVKRLAEYSTICGIEAPTACVDENNTKSLHVMAEAGFLPTGKTYQWTPNPYPRTAIELRFERL